MGERPQVPAGGSCPFQVIHKRSFWLNNIGVLIVELKHSLPDVGVARVLALHLWFTLQDQPVLLGPFVYTLAVKIWGHFLVLIAADLLLDPLYGF